MLKTTALYVYLLIASIPAIATDCVSDIVVDEVYPTGEVLPENLLRLYIYFTGDMSKAGALDAIELRNANGARVQGAFLTNKIDLWSPDARRLTVLFDPGRVKTGLIAHNTMGRALNVGEHYTLYINQSMRTANGCALAGSFQKSFLVSNPDFEPPRIDQWKIQPPKTDSLNWLSVTLNGPHDHVSLAYRIRVLDQQGSVLPGHIKLKKNESEWLFKPSQPWGHRNYSISIDPLLEDISGNRITGSFEKPLGHTNEQPLLIEFNAHK